MGGDFILTPKGATTDIVNEMVSIGDFIKEKFPGVHIYFQNIPKNPTPNTFVVRFQNDSRSLETGFGIIAQREYQLICFEERAPDILTKMDGLSRKLLYKRTVIPIKDSLRYIRIAGFGFGQIFTTEQNNIEACIGVLQTEVREARDQETFNKVMNVYARYN